jgi:hypothetical protein
MILMRLRRAFVLLAALLAAVCVVPSRADAGPRHHHAKHTRTCVAPRLSSSWHNSLGTPHSTNDNPSDDAADYFDDRDTRTDPTSPAALDDDATSSSESAITLPWVRARRTADPYAARLVVFRRLAAPRPPPSL